MMRMPSFEARNEAVKKAQEAVDVYNRFFDKK